MAHDAKPRLLRTLHSTWNQHAPWARQRAPTLQQGSIHNSPHMDKSLTVAHVAVRHSIRFVNSVAQCGGTNVNYRDHFLCLQQEPSGTHPRKVASNISARGVIKVHFVGSPSRPAAVRSHAFTGSPRAPSKRQLLHSAPSGSESTSLSMASLPPAEVDCELRALPGVISALPSAAK